MLKFLPKLHRIYYKSRFEIEGKNIKEINAELDMVFEFVEYVLGKGGITCMQTKCIGGQTLLHHAVWEGKADLCNLLIKSGAELDATNFHGETPLGTAIKTSNLDLVKLLLKLGANPNCGECLHLAVEKGRTDLCELLIDFGAKLDATNVYGETPLEPAIRTSNLDLVKLLLKRGANPNCRECLHHAVWEGKADVCKLLIQSGAELDATNVYGETPLGTAIRTSNLDLVKLLLKHGANPNCGECFGFAPPLHMAIINNNLELVKLLLKRGANPNCGECLHLAVTKGGADLCNLLIKSGAELDATNVYGETPLGTAIKTSNLDLVKLLLKLGANPNCEECLHLAVEKGRADMCELLIDSGAKLDAMNANKDTPLLTAIRNNNLELVKLLLKRGANPNCGECLHLAVKKGGADLCNLLIKSGAELDATNVYGETPLGTAIKTSNLDLVKLLLKLGANPNCGECLLLAVEKGRTDSCELLIVFCAKLDATNVYGETPLGPAIRTSNLDLVKLLLKRGANPNCGECLHLAVKKGRSELEMVLEFVEYVLGKGANTCMQTKCIGGQTLLHHAVWEGRSDLCELLIDLGAELDATNACGETPLGTAIKTSNLDLVKWFLFFGANPNCGECLHLAVKNGSADVCNLLIKSGAEIDATNVHGETPLGTAIKTSNLDLVKLLLKSGANPNCGACLHLAVEKGRADLCELLIDFGAKLDAMNANKEYPLHVAVRNNNLELVNFLLVKTQTDPNCGRKRRRNAEEHETVILQEKMDLDNATLSVLKRCRISKDAMSK
ncbi:hypothetical protein QYM36_002353 [Artemia franciscana]|uniref:Uncharacterized protein n=1 Tax=Artemia franciscana TaxID=6661 RepID=A0AA88IB80_ARTSF|nr:hypothetical protein QYM36_002353 [Artemia franciscana]